MPKVSLDVLKKVDYLVAKHIMKYDLHTDPDEEKEEKGEEPSAKPAISQETGTPLPEKGSGLSSIPAFSMDMLASFILINHLRTKGWLIRLEDHLTSWDASFRRAGVSDFHGEGVEFQASHSIKELAICLAALKIIGIDITQDYAIDENLPN